jgi:hypothetical protein
MWGGQGQGWREGEERQGQEGATPGGVGGDLGTRHAALLAAATNFAARQHNNEVLEDAAQPRLPGGHELNARAGSPVVTRLEVLEDAAHSRLPGGHEFDARAGSPVVTRLEVLDDAAQARVGTPVVNIRNPLSLLSLPPNRRLSGDVTRDASDPEMGASSSPPGARRGAEDMPGNLYDPEVGASSFRRFPSTAHPQPVEPGGPPGVATIVDMVEPGASPLEGRGGRSNGQMRWMWGR